MGTSFSSSYGGQAQSRVYNWEPDPTDADAEEMFFEHCGILPSTVSLRDYMPRVYDQKTLGSCTANALAAAYEYDMNQRHRFEPSRLFIYYNERNMEHTSGVDSGARIVDGISSLKTTGVCRETDWPYDCEKFAEKPPEFCYADALLHRALKEYKVGGIESMKRSLCAGYPVVFGVMVYESFERASDGNVPMPDTDTEKLLGGHAILATGYNEYSERIEFRNSWGEMWGMGGYGTLPYTYVENSKLCNSFWVIKAVTDAETEYSTDETESTCSESASEASTDP